jgi:hypothetical protein
VSRIEKEKYKEYNITLVREVISEGYGKLLYEGQAANTDAEENVVSKLKGTQTFFIL